jgi:hypothetical protein
MAASSAAGPLVSGSCSVPGFLYYKREVLTFGAAVKEALMTAPVTVPLTIEPEAAAYLAQLGMQAELEKMIEHTRQVVPDLTRIRIVLEPIYEPGDEQRIGIEAFVDPDSKEDASYYWPWREWQMATFPYEVFRHFTLSLPIDALAVLDSIEADPARRAAAIATLPP